MVDVARNVRASLTVKCQLLVDFKQILSRRQSASSGVIFSPIYSMILSPFFMATFVKSPRPLTPRFTVNFCIRYRIPYNSFMKTFPKELLTPLRKNYLPNSIRRKKSKTTLQHFRQIIAIQSALFGVPSPPSKYTASKARSLRRLCFGIMDSRRYYSTSRPTSTMSIMLLPCLSETDYGARSQRQTTLCCATAIQSTKTCVKSHYHIFMNISLIRE